MAVLRLVISCLVVALVVASIQAMRIQRCDLNNVVPPLCLGGNDVRWALLSPDDVIQECYYNAAIDPWYYWRFVDENYPAANDGFRVLYETGIMGMGYEQSQANDGDGCDDGDQTGVNKFIYLEGAQGCPQLGTAAMAGRYCDIISGFTGTCRVGVITRNFQSYSTCNGVYYVNPQRIEVIDQRAPYMGLPSDVTVECGSSTVPAITGTPYAFDRCDTAAPSLTPSDAVANGCGSSRIITRTWRAQDTCGNFQTQAQTITVADTLPPTFTSLPDDLQVQCTALLPAAPAATASDVCNPTPTVTTSTAVTTSTCTNREVRRYTYTADDGCQTTSHVYTQTAYDSIPPIITGLVDGSYTEVQCRPPVPVVAATDNCLGTITPSFTEELFAVENRIGLFDLHREVTASDECGNTATVRDLVRFTQPATFSIAAMTTAIPFAPAMNLQFSVTATTPCPSGIAANEVFVYFEPYPFTSGGIAGFNCDTSAVANAGGEFRCNIPAGTSPFSGTLLLNAPTWLVSTGQQWRIKIGVASFSWANTLTTQQVVEYVITG